MLRIAIIVLTCYLTLPAFAQMSTRVGDWPQWRGLNRDGISKETGLLNSWPEAGPKLAWSVKTVGAGYAGPALVGDRIYILGDLTDGCYIIALERATGKTIWKTRIGNAGGNTSYPGTRATPTIDGDKLITMNQHGDILSLNIADGQIVWRKNIERDFGGVTPKWNWAEAPLVDGEQIICTPGSPEGTLLSLNKQNGQLLWRSKEVTNVAAYCSVIPAEIAGTRQYLQLTVDNVFGVDSKTGALLWNAPRRAQNAIVPTLIFSDDIVYATSGYGIGCHAFRIEKKEAKFTATQIYADKSIASHHGGVVKVGDYLYGYSETGGWTCQEFKTGKIVWQDKGVGKGSVTYADGMLYCRCEDGPIALVEATPAGYKEHGRFKQPDRSSTKSWPHPVIADKRLYIRDQQLLLVYDIAGQ
jgi:outer membrane protein assembly factor BamB